jgi:hypothetical protein
MWLARGRRQLARAVAVDDLEVGALGLLQLALLGAAANEASLS